MMNKGHAVFGPSGAERWSNCTASILLSEKSPPSQESKWSKEGTDAHTCMETFFIEMKKGNTIAGVRAQLKKYPPEMIQHAQDAYNTVMGLKKKDAIVLAEQKVDISPFTRKGEFGTCDVAIVQEFSELTIIDYKYGAGHTVDVVENKQLILYALGVAHKYNYNFETVKLGVIQPRAHHRDGDVRFWALSMDELLKWKPFFLSKVKEALGPNPKYQEGEHCFFCPGKAECPELSSGAMKRAAVAFTTEDTLPMVQSVPMVSGITTPAAIGAALTAAMQLEKWIDGLKARAEALLDAGVAVPGWKLEPKRATAYWSDEKKALKDAKSFGPGVMTLPTLKTPPQMRDFLNEKDFDGDAWVAKRSTKISSGFNLVKDSQAGKTTKTTKRKK